MPIKATFPAGVLTITVNGLHQWDYGQVLEIHDDTLPALIEVHFACQGMREAVVRACAVEDGVARAVIPDTCLEQTTPVTAWVYQVDETSGATIKTAILAITPRAKPQVAASLPAYVADKYTEMVAAMNTLIGNITEGKVEIGHATEADHALTADAAAEATHADEADHAAAADHAATADTAAEASHATTADTAANVQQANYANSANYATNANRATHAETADEAVHAATADAAGTAGTATTATYAKVASNGNIEKDLIPWMMMVETDLLALKQAAGISLE